MTAKRKGAAKAGPTVPVKVKAAMRKIGAAFWHRGRQLWLPWTRDELRARCGVEDDLFALALRQFVERGWASYERRNNGVENVSIYQLTEAGIAQAAPKTVPVGGAA